MAPTITQLRQESEAEEEDSRFDKARFADVQYGAEFYRIVGLARRAIPAQDDPEAIEIADFCTKKLAKCENPYPGRLKPIQGLAFKEAWECGGMRVACRMASAVRAMPDATLRAQAPPAAQVDEVQQPHVVQG